MYNVHNNVYTYLTIIKPLVSDKNKIKFSKKNKIFENFIF